jgi:hypothetical protein
MSDVAALDIIAPPPAGGSAAPVVPVDQMTPEQALARHREIMSAENMADWRAAFAKGDIAKRDELAALHRIIEGATPQASEAALQREKFIDHLRSTADIPDEVADMIRHDTPVSAHERRMAEQERGRLMADPEFVKRWLAGHRAERRTMALVDVILARPVKQ